MGQLHLDGVLLEADVPHVVVVLQVRHANDVGDGEAELVVPGDQAGRLDVDGAGDVHRDGQLHVLHHLDDVHVLVGVFAEAVLRSRDERADAYL